MADDTRVPYIRTYGGRHLIPTRAWGRAAEYACEDCGGFATQWATIHGRDGFSAEDYRPLCGPCHTRYDGRNIGEQNASAKLTEDQVREIRKRYAAGGVSLRTLGQEYGVGKSAIHQIVKGRNWKRVT